MHHVKTPDWLQTAQGEPRGYIEPKGLSELWFHTGTICNLACPFCLEGSKPGDDRIQPMTFDDARPFLDEAVELGVEQFSFTGGEPFVTKDFVRILGYALERRPCLVLTNATKPIQRRMDEVLALLEKPHPVRFRISLDYPDPDRHDANRGEGAFQEALTTAAELHRHGFKISFARQTEGGEDAESVNRAFLPYLAEVGLPSDTHIHSFPDFRPPGACPEVPDITENCMMTHHDEASRARFMCSFSKFVLRKNGRARVYACTLVDDDSTYDLGGSLREAMQYRVMLRHHRCFSCFSCGATCSDG
jgi:hypothetical protein